MVILDSFIRIGVNDRPHFGRPAVVTLRVSYRVMAQTVLEPHLMLVPYDLVSTEEE